MLHIKIISPEKVILETDADQISAPTTTGEITILPHHIPLVTQLADGELIVKIGSKETAIAVAGGFLEVGSNTVSVLADYAITSEAIEESRAQEAKERAEKLMKEKKSDRDFAEAQAIFRRAILELKIASKRKHYRGGPPRT